MKQDDIEQLKTLLLKRSYYTSRCQARMRGHEWQISQEEFFELWGEDDKWAKKGRHSHSLTLSRIDMDGDWTLDNVHIITRAEMLKIEGKYRSQNKCK